MIGNVSILEEIWDMTNKAFMPFNTQSCKMSNVIHIFCSPAVRPDGLHIGVQIMCEPRQEDGHLVRDAGEDATPLKRPSTNIGKVTTTVIIVSILMVYHKLQLLS